MKNKSGNKAKALCIVLLGFFVFFSAGCDKYTRYKVLTFFFTGVPHPDAPKEKAASASGNTPSKKMTKPELEVFEHGPYGANQCYSCHAISASNITGKDGSRQEKPSIPSFQGGLPGGLIAPIKELCIECHISKSVKSAYSKDLWIHGPVSDGMCTVCHSPHQSQYRFMLLSGKSNNMCSRCHAKGFIIETDDHKQEKECVSCHNPHFGKDRFMLKKDYDEAY